MKYFFRYHKGRWDNGDKWSDCERLRHDVPRISTAGGAFLVHDDAKFSDRAPRPGSTPLNWHWDRESCLPTTPFIRAASCHLWWNDLGPDRSCSWLEWVSFMPYCDFQFFSVIPKMKSLDQTCSPNHKGDHLVIFRKLNVTYCSPSNHVNFSHLYLNLFFFYSTLQIVYSFNKIIYR